MKEKDVWYKQLGFYNNPFSIKPAAFYDELLGYENVVKKVNHSIATKKLVYVEGNYGNGKSTLLRKILHRFGGKGKIIYFSCNRIEDNLNINKLLHGRYGFVGKMFNIKPKNMILLLDEAQWLPKEDYARILRYYRGGYFRSIVFVGKSFNEEVFADGFRHSLNHVKLGDVNEEDAVQIIRKRVGNLPLLTNDIIKAMFKKAGENVRKLLKYAELACKMAIEREEDTVTPEMIDETFAGESEVVENVEGAEEAVKEVEKKFEEVKEAPEEPVEEVKETIDEEKTGEELVDAEETEAVVDSGEEKTKEELEDKATKEVEEILEATPAEEIIEEIKPRAAHQEDKVEELYY